MKVIKGKVYKGEKEIMNYLKKKILKIGWEKIALFLIILIAGFLRLYKIQDFQYFTYDQARDYLIIKRMIVDHKFTLVGPTLSIAPGVFPPPFYYYSLIPFLWLFKFRIAGPDVYTAVLGISAVYFFYFLAKDFFSKKSALFLTFFFAINPYLIHTSRHAWNPNTIYLFSILFALAFERYWLKKERKYCILASFSLAWAIGLHLTAIVLLPFWFLILRKEVRKKSFDLFFWLAIVAFLIVFLPLCFFEVRHGFQIIKNGFLFLASPKVQGNLGEKISNLIVDLIKMPVVFLSGLGIKENLTVRPSNITPFFRFAFSVKAFSLVFIALFVFSFLLCLRDSTRIKKTGTRLILFLWLSGFINRLFFPPTFFYFYYYLLIFPFSFLVLGFLIEEIFLLKSLLRNIILTFIILIFIFSSAQNFLITEVNKEDYYLPVSKSIFKDALSSQNIAVAANVADRTRWEKNGLEYRYFLEAFYKLPSTGWDKDDYQRADVLYLIDEGDLPEPLKFGGMEMEAFKPVKIEKAWKVETGQKVYKLLKN